MKNIKLMLQYSKNLDVLYVEDDISLIKSTSELLSNYFKSIEIAYDGQEGLDKYKKHYREYNKYYDLVITDINMPKLDGLEMSREVLKENQLQSIVITTAHNETKFLAKAIELGVGGFVTKPINNEQLIKVLHKVCKVISDHQFVELHIGMVEALNLELDEKNILLNKQNRELTDKNSEIEKSFRMLDTMVHKKQLTDSNSLTQEIVQHSVEDDVFIQEQIEHLIYDDLNELREIHGEIDLNIINILNSIDKIDNYILPNLVKQFSKYASILAAYTFFDELGSSMKVFADTLNDNPLPDNTESIANIFMLLESFMYVLGKWQDDLALGDANNINSLDASMISDMHTITNMWTQVKEEFVEDDLDGIFDF